MKKKCISLLLAVVMLCSMIPTASAASDEAAEAANVLYQLGLFQGTGTDASGNPKFDLDRTPTRNEAVTMLVRLLGKEAEARAGAWDIPFTDVADWARPYVGYAYANGLTTGTSATTFGGDATVTASQYLTFVLRALGYASGTDFQWNAAWVLSDQIGLTDGSYSAQTTKFLRGDVAAISCSALNTAENGTDTTLLRELVDAGAVDAYAAAVQGFDVYGVTDNVHLIYDIRTFTLYAFMNYTGFDDNNGNPITGVRKALREDLAAMDLQLSEPDYFTKKGVDDRYYANALRSMGAAPDFTYLSSNVTPALSDLPAKLREFYEAANIPALYEKYRANYEAVLSPYQDGLSDIAAMVCYLDAQAESEFGLEVNLLDAWGRGSGVGTTDLYYGYGVIRTGPSNEVNTLNILHEYAHGFVNQAVDAFPTQISALSGYFAADSAAVTAQGYDNWKEIVEESFVRGISIYFDNSESPRQERRWPRAIQTMALS